MEQCCNLRRYNKAELRKLKLLFSVASKSEILSVFPNRTWSSLRHTAYHLGYSRGKFALNIPKNNFCRLLESSPVAHYWVGFLLADGSLSKKGQLTLSCCVENKNHIEHFASFVNSRVKIEKESTSGYKIGKPYCRVAIASKINSQKLTDKFGFYNRKTYNPPPIEKYCDIEQDLFLSLLVGFIDGDGTIRQTSSRGKRRNACAIRIKLHKSWLVFLTMCCDRLNAIIQMDLPSPKINKQGYASWEFSKGSAMSVLVTNIEQHSLPVLEKWIAARQFYKTEYTKCA